jgi:RHS repeat-associated protein
MTRFAFRQATRGIGLGRMATATIALVATVSPAWASEPNAQRVSHFVGAAGESVAIQVPPFHGIEPRLGLSYSSEARNGFAGMGWSLTGVSVIERVNPKYGYPQGDAYDTFQLDGQPMALCEAGTPWSTYPSCATGGTHYTVKESYLRIKKVSDTLWEVHGKDGTKTEFTPIYTPGGLPTLRFGQSKVVDTHGNTVDYIWEVNADSINGNTYISSIAYNGYRVRFLRETRPDPLTQGLPGLTRQTQRLSSIVVELASGSPIRGYKLGYETSPATGKSLLKTVQMFGKNLVVVDNQITSGMSLPPQTFGYLGDGAAATIGGDVQLATAGPPATPAGTVENVVWTVTSNARATGDGSTLTADAVEDNWDKSGHSSRGITSGLGWVEFDAGPGQIRAIYMGNVALYAYTDQGQNYINAAANGEWVDDGNGTVPVAVSTGDKIRLEIVDGGAHWKVNGVPVRWRVTTISYPIVVGAGFYGGGDSFANVKISGSLVNYWGSDCGGAKRFTGDFNGDSRQDFVCKNNEGSVLVTLATASGFANPMIWASSGETLVGAGDFNNDGRDDIVFYDSFWGTTFVGLSDGVDFGAITAWGAITGYSPYTGSHACRMDGAKIAKVADFTGDGRADLLCYTPADPGRQFVAISEGTSFSSEWLFGESDCPAYDSVDANADGREDVLCITPDGPNAGDVRTLTSLGYGFIDSGVLSSFCSLGEFSFGDWNGDGTTDAACANNGRVALRTAGGWVDMGTPPAPHDGSYCVSGQRLSLDLNGDGAAEWICNNPGDAGNDIEIRRWTGFAFGEVQTLRGGFCSGLLTLADADGDGKKDVLCEASGAVAYSGSKGVKADLLTSSANGLGGSSTLTYTTTTQHIPGSTKGLPVKYIVVATTANDGRTAPATTSFTYDTGTQNDVERRFIGFENVMEYPPAVSVNGASAQSKIWRRFHVDKTAGGRLDFEVLYNAAGSAVSYTQNAYTIVDTTGPGARGTAHVTATWNYKYNGSVPQCPEWPMCGDWKRTKSDFTYDTYGNVFEVINWGDYQVSGDETFTRHSRAPNTGAYIVGQTSLVQTWKGTSDQGEILGWTANRFDGVWWDVAPTKGDLTRTEQYLVGVGGAADRWVPGPRAQYDTYGNVTATFDSNEQETRTTTYDSTYHMFPNVTSNAAGETSTASWEPKCGLAAEATDPNQVQTISSVDDLCRPTTTSVTGAGTVSSVSYLDFGNPNLQRVRTEAPGPNGTNDWSESYFDGFGRTYRSVKRGPSAAETIVTEAAFDLRGNVQSQTAPYYSDLEHAPAEELKITTFQYDELNRLLKTTLPDGKMRTRAYPGLSPESLYQVVDTNELAQESRTKSDLLGRVRKTETIRQTSGTLATTRDYDVLGRLKEVKDPLNNTWTYEYDTLGRTVSKSDPDAGSTAYTYYDDGRLKSQTDAKGQTITLEYDVIGRPQYRRVRPTGGATGTITETVETAYGTSSNDHNVGRVTQIVTKNGAGVEQSGKLQFEYDTLGRVVKQTRTIDEAPYVVERNYDTAGYLLGMKYPDNDILGTFGGSGSALEYDGAGRLKKIPGILTSVTYSALGAPEIQTNENGTVTTRSYHPQRSWLTDINTVKGSAVFQDLEYGFNEAGLASAVTSSVTDENWSYVYNDLNQLKSTAKPGGSAYDQTWDYDSIGRFTRNSRVGEEFTYQNSVSNRPHAATEIKNGPLGLMTLDHDGNGNVKTRQGRTLTWNGNNQLIQVGAGGSATTFEYGPDGTRIKKSSAVGGEFKYPFGDDHEIGPGGVVTKYFDAGFGPIAKKVGSVLYWLHNDRLGSVNLVTEASGSPVLRKNYYSYGSVLASTGGEEQPVVWTQFVNASGSASSLTKTADHWAWDAGAISTQSLSGDGYVEVTATASILFIGLGQGNTDATHLDVDFALYTEAGQLYVRENGEVKASLGAVAVGDKLRVSVEDGEVKYRKNGILLHTSATAPTFPLVVDTSLLQYGLGIQNAVISIEPSVGPAQNYEQAVSWMDLTNASANGSSLTKVADHWAWDAGAVSRQALNGDGYVQATASAQIIFVGLSHGNQNATHLDVDFALYAENGHLFVRENGEVKADFGSGSVTPGDNLKVSVEGGVVKYLKNGALLYTSATAPTFPLRVDTSLLQYNLGITNAVIYGASAPVRESLGYIGQRTDDETGLMYLHARYYDPVLGVFLSPDPSDPLEEGVGTNRYIYGLGNPIWYRDPGGLNSKTEGKTGEKKSCPYGYEANPVGECVVSTKRGEGVDVTGTAGELPEFRTPGRGRLGKDLNDDHLFDQTKVRTQDIRASNQLTRALIAQVRKENCEYYDQQMQEGLNDLVNGSYGNLAFDFGVDAALLMVGAAAPIGEFSAVIRFAARSRAALGAIMAVERAQTALQAAATTAAVTKLVTADLANAVKIMKGLGERPPYCSAN